MPRLTLPELLVLALLAMIGVSGHVGTRPATAQDNDVPTAAIVQGTCADLGDAVLPLNDLRVRDGGDVLVSLTTVDRSLSDFVEVDHAYVAVVATNGANVVACGDPRGTGPNGLPEGDDLYVPLATTTDAGWGGVAWFHVRGDRSQVSLFIARGLGETAPRSGSFRLPANDDAVVVEAIVNNGSLPPEYQAGYEIAIAASGQAKARVYPVGSLSGEPSAPEVQEISVELGEDGLLDLLAVLEGSGFFQLPQEDEGDIAAGDHVAVIDVRLANRTWTVNAASLETEEQGDAFEAALAAIEDAVGVERPEL